MARRKPEQLDALDSELIQETLGSLGWQLIKQGLENMRNAKIRDLVRPCSEMETAQLRGAIEAIESAINLPSTLMKQIKNGEQR